jgi:hypothetical protein
MVASVTERPLIKAAGGGEDFILYVDSGVTFAEANTAQSDLNS